MFSTVGTVRTSVALASETLSWMFRSSYIHRTDAGQICLQVLFKNIGLYPNAVHRT
jgi:hypothetical protein